MKTLVRAFIIGTFVVWVGFDVWLSQNGGPTESAELRDIAYRLNLLPFLGGFLLAHWFMPTRRAWPSGWVLAIPILLVIGTMDAVHWNSAYVWYRYPGIWAILGIPAGHFLWPQPPR